MMQETEKKQPIEVGAQEELEKRVIDTIVTLVNHANNIAAENSTTEEPFLYKDVKDAKTYIDKTDEHVHGKKGAIEEYEKLKGMKKAHFWTIGRNKAKADQTQVVIGQIIDAVDNNAFATQALFNDQTNMAKFSKELYAIGLMGIASNRMVVRQIKLRLERASEEELSELARQELESVLYELKLQQNIAEKVDLVEENLIEAINKHNQLAEHVDENQADVLAIIEAANKDMKSSNEQFETKLNEVKDEGNQRAKKTEESFQTLIAKSEIHENRLGILEKKSFFDSSVYKILVGVLAVGALIISLINYFK